MTAPELLLVRHGRSAHVERGWIDVHGVRRWMAAYDAAEIAPDHAPPPELVLLARDAVRVIASDLPRTVASAMRLAPDREIVRTPLLREAPMETPELPLPALGGIRLPLRAWGTIWGMRWLSAWLRSAPPPGVDAAVLARADEAAAWLADQAMEAGGRVVVVTHATFRVVLTQALVRRGWRGPDQRPYRAWSAWRYHLPLR
jgi:broad specificity phosphatase PhoE